MALLSQRATRSEEAKFDIKFEISNLKNPIIHMHIAPRNQYGDLRGHGSLKTASEAASDVKFEIRVLVSNVGPPTFVQALSTARKGPKFVWHLS